MLRFVLLAIGLAVAMQGHASTCLRETAPEVARYLFAGDSERIREAIGAIDERANQSDASLAAPWLSAQASMQLDIGEIDAAIVRLRRAIKGWLTNGRVDAEVCTRHLLAFALSLQSRPRQALSETVLAQARANTAGLDEAVNRLRQTHITLLLTLNERLEDALVLMDESRPGQSAAERISWHHIRGLMLSRLNRHRRAARQFEQVIELADREGMAEMAAAARLNLANQLDRTGRRDPASVPRDRITGLLERVVADAAARPATRALALRSLAPYKPRGQRLQLLAECERQAALASDQRRRAVCLADRAELLVNRDPDQALAVLAQAVTLTDGDPMAQWQIQAQRMAVIWATEPPLQAFYSSLAAIDGERQLRDLQMTGPERARLIDGLSWDYRRLADLAYRHARIHPELAAQAFNLLSANRALVLREQRMTQGDDEELDKVRELAERINQTQGVLLSSQAPPHEIKRARQAIEQLEAAWHKAALRPPKASEPLPDGPSLSRIQSVLSSDEALLSFLTSIPGHEGDEPGWLHIATARASRIYRIPGQQAVLNAATLLEGFENWNSAAAGNLLKQLSNAILAPALTDLGDEISHLVVVPDGGVDRLPLERLPGSDGQLLGTRYSIDMAPSAGVWLDARMSDHATGTVLALADPQLPEAGYGALDIAYPNLAPPELPGAADEVYRIKQLAGHRHARLYIGEAASEGALQRATSNASGGLIHFATHTLIHPEDHAHSAILLTADQSGDGLLQPREIERLQLAGTGIVLASCASASGERLENEGIISLARSFMIAGAPSVIATRWPVNDEHAGVFVQRLYRHMADGQDQSAAMRLARADLQARGYPDSAWAGWVLIGDGRWHPLPIRRSWPAWVALALAAGLLVSVISRSCR